MSLRDRQVDLYSRQIILRELGGTGQRKLLSARCALAGGGPALATVATYLAGAGVGRIDLRRDARAPRAATEPDAMAWAELATRSPDVALGVIEPDATRSATYDAVVLADVAESARAVLDGLGFPRRGEVAIRRGGSAVDLLIAPRGDGCLACLAVAGEPSDARSPEAAPRGGGAGYDTIALALAGAMAALVVCRWVAEIEPDRAARALRLAPGDAAWRDVPIARAACPRGCSR
ncbi:MAG TPA: hypothetical protein VFD84_17190 [Candidatus Binatia bacterium]|nr:hypothetical protein [Candidatus Binatia bacterium]